jgi:nucleoside-diphosphate-sugar epimerase
MAGSFYLPDGARLTARNYLREVQPALDPHRFADERVLITGASGFIGTNLLEFYRGWGASAVANLDIAAPRDSDHHSAWMKVDICDAPGLRAAILNYRPTAVFHLAARADLIGKTAADYPENSDGVRNVIAAMRELPNRPRLIVASSRMVCDIRHHPINDTDYSAPNGYGQSKVLTETVTRSECGNSIPWILVRPTGIWGPWFDIPYRNFFDTVRLGLYMHPGQRRVFKSYGFVGNTVYQLDRLMFAGFARAQGRTLYVTDPPTEILPWARQIASAYGKRPPWSAPYPLLAAGAKVGDLLQKLGWYNPPLTSFRLDNLTTDMVIDYMLAEDVCGPTPYPMEDAIAVTIDWLSQGIATAQKGQTHATP